MFPSLVTALPHIKAGRLGEQAADVMPTTPAEAAEFIRREVAKWTRLVKDSGMKLEQ